MTRRELVQRNVFDPERHGQTLEQCARLAVMRLEDQFVLANRGQDVHEQLVLAMQDALGQTFFGVVREDWYSGLGQDGSGVRTSVDKMHGAAGNSSAISERGGLRIHAGERWQQRWMDVDHAVWERIEQHGRDDAHEPCEHNPGHAVLTKSFDHRCIKGLPRCVVLMVHDTRRHARCFGSCEPLYAGPIGDHEAHARIEVPLGDGIENRLEIGSAAGNEDTEVERHGREHGSRGDEERHFATIACRAWATSPYHCRHAPSSWFAVRCVGSDRVQRGCCGQDRSERRCGCGRQFGYAAVVRRCAHGGKYRHGVRPDERRFLFARGEFSGAACRFGPEKRRVCGDIQLGMLRQTRVSPGRLRSIAGREQLLLRRPLHRESGLPVNATETHLKTMADLPLLSGATWNGHAAEFRRNPPELFLRAQKEFVDIGKIELFKFPVAVLFDPELVHELMVEKHKQLFKSLALKIMFYPMAGRGLFTSDGDLWRRQRKLMAPLFHPPAIRSYAAMMNDVMTRCLDTWKDGDVIDAGKEMTRIAMGVAAKTLFDADTLNESEGISEAIHAMFHYISDHQGSPLVIGRAMLAGKLIDRTDLSPRLAKWRDRAVEALHQAIPLPTPERVRLLRGLRLLDERIQRMTDERRRTGVDRDDLLSRLLAARDEDDGTFMTDQQVRDEAMTLFVAGHETTATSNTWSLYFLSRYPDVYRRWKEEVAQLNGEQPSPDNTSKLTWTRGIFREALRINAPAFAVDRVAMEDVELAGYSFPRLTSFILPIYAIHRNAKFWPDPDRFDPGRFAPEVEAKRPRAAYLPFGIGPRVCIGAMFAELEAMLLLTHVAQRFEFEPLDTKPIGPDLRTVMRPEKPILMRVRKTKR